jgi:acylphosphatase
MSERRVGYVVRGRVQGVAFRAFTQGVARRRGVAGWVANHHDGSVRGEVQGAAGDVEAFLAEIREGSPWSRVDEVVVNGREPVDGETGFGIRY